MKKLLRCGVYFIVILMVFTSCSKVNAPEQSTHEKSEKIEEMNEELLSKCEKMKCNILSVIEKIYKDDDSLVYGTTAEDATEAFKKYYDEKIEFLETQKGVEDYLIMFEYGSGSYGSIAHAEYENDTLTALYDELTDIYNKLIEITGYEIENPDRNDDYEAEDKAVTTQISEMFGIYVPTLELSGENIENVLDRVFYGNVIDRDYIKKLSDTASTADIVKIQNEWAAEYDKEIENVYKLLKTVLDQAEKGASGDAARDYIKVAAEKLRYITENRQDEYTEDVIQFHADFKRAIDGQGTGIAIQQAFETLKKKRLEFFEIAELVIMAEGDYNFCYKVE